jgi:SAM-dependent methyltransferase
MNTPTAARITGAGAGAPADGRIPLGFFGQGGHEPYAGSLSKGMGNLTLRPEPSGTEPFGPVHFSVLSWSAPATAGERELLRTLRGPVLDVGCGPGRMLTAALELGLMAMGVDTSAPAVRLAISRGAAAIHGSIFQPVPHEGAWASALLLDGNIGIGGNIRVLLERIALLLAPGGQILAEAETDDSLDAAYLAVLEDSAGRASAAFPWARAGATALAGHAARAGLVPVATRTVQGRVFVTLERRA